MGTFPIGSQPRNIIITPDGNTVYETNFDSKDYYAIDAHTLQLKYVKSLGAPDGIAFSNTAKPDIETYTFRTLDFPGASETAIAQVNDEGTAVGWYVDQNGGNDGFIYQHGHFTGYDVSGSPSTRLLGVNQDGETVGLYTNAHGYINGLRLQNGIRTDVFVEFESNGNTYSVPTNEVDGVDEDGTLVGVYWNFVASANYGFVLGGRTLASFDYPGALYTSANGIAAGTVSGWFADSSQLAHAFFWHDGKFSPYDFPGAEPAPDGTLAIRLAIRSTRSLSPSDYGAPPSVQHTGTFTRPQPGRASRSIFPKRLRPGIMESATVDESPEVTS